MTTFENVKIVQPSQPLPKLEVDTKVLVWDDKYHMHQKRYFSHFNSNNSICVFMYGNTSWTTTQTIEYSNWELAGENNCK